jgi:hypothetical protein
MDAATLLGITAMTFTYTHNEIVERLVLDHLHLHLRLRLHLLLLRHLHLLLQLHSIFTVLPMDSQFL